MKKNTDESLDSTVSVIWKRFSYTKMFKYLNTPKSPKTLNS